MTATRLMLCVLLLAGACSSTDDAGAAGDAVATTDAEPGTPAAVEATPETADADATITIEGFAFGTPLTVPAGQAVMVVNRDTVPHTWTAADDSFDSGRIAPDGTFTTTLEEPGEHAFMCTIHPQMAGSITVT